MKITFIFPVYNNAQMLVTSVKKISAVLEKVTEDYEIIIAEDGSTDGSDIIAKKLSNGNKKIRHLHNVKRLGKGLAIKNAIRNSSFNYIIFSDVDLSYNPSSIKYFIKALKEGNEICIGSRYMKKSRISRIFKRQIFSKAYINLVKVFFRTDISDFQCGFKAFTKKSFPILLGAKDDGFFWDTEMLLEAEKRGLKIKEIPVSFTDSKNSSVRIYRSIPTFLIALIRYKFEKN